MLGTKIAVDFGSSSLTIYVDGRGIAVHEPSLAVCDSFSGKPLAFGSAAQKMHERLPGSMTAVYPVRNGIVRDRKNAAVMLRTRFNKICYGRLLKPNVLMCIPDSLTELQKKTFFDVAISAGAGRVCFISRILASALGAGVSLSEPKGSFTCDIGSDTTVCSVVTMGSLALSKTVSIGGSDLSEAVISYILHRYRVKIGNETAEKIKKDIGTAVPRKEELSVVAVGKNIDSGLPTEFEVSSAEIYEVLEPEIRKIISCVMQVLEITPPELSGDITENGLILTGGSSGLFGLDTLVEQTTHLKTFLAGQPEKCAALGAGRLLKDMKYLDRNGYVFKSDKPENDESEE